MTNFIFKSNADLQKIYHLGEIELAVLREQRLQLDRIEYFLKKLVVDKNLQKQVTDFYDYDETSHQTDFEDKEPD